MLSTWLSAKLPAINWGRFRFLAQYNVEGGRSDEPDVLHDLQQHYVNAPPNEPVKLGAYTRYKKVEQYRATISIKWTASMPKPPTNSEVAAMVQKLMYTIDNEWRAAKGASIHVTGAVDGQFSFSIFSKVTKGEDFSLEADQLQWSGATYDDAKFNPDIAPDLLKSFTEKIKTQSTQAGHTPIALGSALSFNFRDIHISMTFGENEATWPKIFWDDVEKAVEVFDDNCIKKQLYQDFWLHLKYQGQPIAIVTIVDYRDWSQRGVMDLTQTANPTVTVVASE